MFTGIIETLGEVKALNKEGGNLHITVKADITSELNIDQSVAHNGVCLTVVNINGAEYTVTAIDETLQKTNLGELVIGAKVNLERCMVMNGRLDGHIVQGHVDTTGICTKIEEEDGSWKYTFDYTTPDVTVAKGSVTINGVSLTVVDSNPNQFSVCIIPYTHEHTNFHTFTINSKINLEFDIIGKYVAKLMNGGN
jgi:riboflavin synthase